MNGNAIDDIDDLIEAIYDVQTSDRPWFYAPKDDGVDIYPVISLVVEDSQYDEELLESAVYIFTITSSRGTNYANGLLVETEKLYGKGMLESHSVIIQGIT